jgi:hypothetical protein
MNDKQLRRAAIRTLRAGIIPKNPPGERRDRLLARLEAIVERSAHVLAAGTILLTCADRYF